MNLAQLGTPDGPLVVYFHGAPGAPEECRIFDSDANRHGLKVICLDRFAIDAAVRGETYFKRLADEIVKIANGKQVDFVGFSNGAFVALQTTRYMGGSVRRLHVLSAAAPLESGNDLDCDGRQKSFQIGTRIVSFVGGVVLLAGIARDVLSQGAVQSVIRQRSRQGQNLGVRDRISIVHDHSIAVPLSWPRSGVRARRENSILVQSSPRIHHATMR